ncbi:pseudouridine synthase [Leptodontidium sp. MPI-SDFR-AT-0119]|nr:pseudouridine synthase [Leptodontidium sp. MPI-SDFR-AT-0119]
MSANTIWRRMTPKKIMEGVFAVHKPTGISSAQALRDLQHHFNPSELFAPWLEAERAARDRESHNQRKRRKDKRIQVKIGHGGTLDPLATGVLIAGIGKGTKSLQDFLLCTKVYEAVVLFGTDTDTYDRVGKVLKRAPYDHITKEMVEEALEQFRGKFMQLPPLFSALKMNGKPLYEYAREGKEIPREIERREVEVLNLELVEWMEGGTHSHVAPTDEAGHAEINVANMLWKQEDVQPATNEEEATARENFEQKKRKLSEDQDDLILERPPTKSRKAAPPSSAETAMMSGGLPSPSEDPAPQPSIETCPAAEEESKDKGPPAVRLRMTVTSGFYVRSLCHDLGAALGSAALMAELERTRQGEFELGKNVLEWEDLGKGEEVWGPRVEKVLDEWHEKNKTDSSAEVARSS